MTPGESRNETTAEVPRQRSAQGQPKAQHDVFISYRREGGSEMARLIYQWLRNQGYAAFMDVEDLRSGPFNTALLDKIGAATDVVVVLPPEGLDRCRQTGDWVRLEVAHAIKCGKNVVPVMVRGFQWPTWTLPEDIAALPGYHGISPSIDLFDASMKRLAGLLKAKPRRRLLKFLPTAVVAAAAVALIVAAVVVFNGPRGPVQDPGPQRTELNPLALHWYSLGQRLEGDDWRAFQVQDGVTMRDGDQFRVYFLPSADCYVYIVCFNVDGTVTSLFPNPAIQQGGFCKGGQKVQVPDGVNWFTLDDKTGTETLFLVASYDPLTDLQALMKKAQDAPVETGKQVQRQIASVQEQNRPDSTGTIRTRSGIVVRNVALKADRRFASAQLASGKTVEANMEFLPGGATVVQRIQFVHGHPDAKPE